MNIKVMGSFLRSFINKKVTAITLAPFGIYFKNESYMKYTHITNHEKIHWKQQMELLIVIFYIWYILEYLIKMIKCGKDAYRSISFEQEAYEHDTEPLYLLNRKKYSWLKYVFTSCHKKIKKI